MVEAVTPCGRSAIVAAGDRHAKGEDGKPLMGDNMTNPGEKGSFNAKRGVITRTPVGARPSCECNAPKARGTVLDPFGGAGPTGLVADRLQRDAILIELNPEYAGIAQKRLQGDGGMFTLVAAE